MGPVYARPSSRGRWDKGPRVNGARLFNKIYKVDWPRPRPNGDGSVAPLLADYKLAEPPGVVHGRWL
jgi:phenolic acid decarboxylase